MKFWARRTSWLICGLLAAGFFPPQSSAYDDGAPRKQASDITQKRLLSFVGAASLCQSYTFRPPLAEISFRCWIFLAMFTELRHVARQDSQPSQAARPLPAGMAAIVSAASQ